jgi:hypothetical protein
MSGATTAISIAVAVIGASVSAYSQHEAQKSQEKSAKASAAYNAQVAENEAATQQELARNEISKGIADRERQQRSAARAMGEMRANMGASGFEMDSGSNESLLAESAAEHQYDSQIIMNNAEQASWQHLVGQTSALNQKSFADYQYANAGSGSGATNLAMAGTLLGGIGSAVGTYGQWVQAKTQKTPVVWPATDSHGY